MCVFEICSSTILCGRFFFFFASCSLTLQWTTLLSIEHWNKYVIIIIKKKSQRERLTLWINTQPKLLVGFSLPSLNIYFLHDQWWLRWWAIGKEKKKRKAICNILIIPKTPWIHIHTQFSERYSFTGVWRKWADYVVIPLFRLLQNSIE